MQAILKTHDGRGGQFVTYQGMYTIVAHTSQQRFELRMLAARIRDDWSCSCQLVELPDSWPFETVDVSSDIAA